MLGDKDKLLVEKTLTRWRKMRAAKRIEDIDMMGYGSRHCPLCEEYLEGADEPYIDEPCIDCPVERVTGIPECKGTPYRRFIVSLNRGNFETVKKTIDEIINFIENIHEKLDKWSVKTS